MIAGLKALAWRFTSYITVSVFAGMSASSVVIAAETKKLTISCGSNGLELQMCKSGVEAWSKKNNIAVDIFSSPNDSNDRLALYQQLLGAGSSDVDVYQMDVVWPGLLAKHFVDISTYYSDAEAKDFVPGAWKNGIVDGKLVAIPWFTDGGVLYFRKDLLLKYKQAVPKTWAQLEQTAQTIQEGEKKAGATDLWGLVFQGRAYEGLTCNALEWVSSFGGGQIVDDSGSLSVNNPNSVRALELFSGWMGKIVPKGVLSYSEEEARAAFQSGKSIFMRNWPYAWALLNTKDSLVEGKVGMAPLPSGKIGGIIPSALGGWSLGVSKYSKYQKDAAQLAKYLTSYSEQKRRAIEASFNPSRIALFDDKEVLAKNPHLKELKAVFTQATPRPARQTGQKYNRLSSDFWNAVHACLSGRTKADQTLSQLESRVSEYSNQGKWQ